MFRLKLSNVASKINHYLVDHPCDDVVYHRSHVWKSSGFTKRIGALVASAAALSVLASSCFLYSVENKRNAKLRVKNKQQLSACKRESAYYFGVFAVSTIGVTCLWRLAIVRHDVDLYYKMARHFSSNPTSSVSSIVLAPMAHQSVKHLFNNTIGLATSGYLCICAGLTPFEIAAVFEAAAASGVVATYTEQIVFRPNTNPWLSLGASGGVYGVASVAAVSKLCSVAHPVNIFDVCFWPGLIGYQLWKTFSERSSSIGYSAHSAGIVVGGLLGLFYAFTK